MLRVHRQFIVLRYTASHADSGKRRRAEMLYGVARKSANLIKMSLVTSAAMLAICLLALSWDKPAGATLPGENGKIVFSDTQNFRELRKAEVQLRRMPLPRTWVNRPPWRCARVRCVACFGVLVARDTCKGRQVRRSSPRAPHSCGRDLPGRVRGSSTSGWLCRDSLGNLQQEGAGKLTQSNRLRRSPMRGDTDHQGNLAPAAIAIRAYKTERRLYHERPAWLPK